jgi:hypothetical protein
MNLSSDLLVLISFSVCYGFERKSVFAGLQSTRLSPQRRVLKFSATLLHAALHLVRRQMFNECGTDRGVGGTPSASFWFSATDCLQGLRKGMETSGGQPAI